MKKLIVFLWILPAWAFCQKYSKKDEVPANLRIAIYNISGAVSKNCEIDLPFKNIVVLDARFDTSKLGFEISRKFIDVNFKDFKKIKLEGGTQKAIQEFYNEYYKSCFKDRVNELLIVLKTLWIDNVPNRSFKEGRRTYIVKDSYQDIHTKVEFYLQNENKYYPLKKIDTVYQLTEQNLPQFDMKLKVNDLTFFMYAIKDLIERNNFIELVNNAANRRQLTFNQIDSFNNNRPSVTDYKIDEYGILKIKTDSVDSKNYWAIADGSGLHLWAHSRLDSWSYMRKPVKSDMVRTGNTFEFFIFDQIVVPTTFSGDLVRFLFIDINPGNGGKIRSVMIPRQLDMETGEVY